MFFMNAETGINLVLLKVYTQILSAHIFNEAQYLEIDK